MAAVLQKMDSSSKSLYGNIFCIDCFAAPQVILIYNTVSILQTPQLGFVSTWFGTSVDGPGFPIVHNYYSQFLFSK